MAEKYVTDDAHNRYPAYCCEDMDKSFAKLASDDFPVGSIIIAAKKHHGEDISDRPEIGEESDNLFLPIEIGGRRHPYAFVDDAKSYSIFTDHEEFKHLSGTWKNCGWTGQHLATTSTSAYRLFLSVWQRIK